ncbi:MAG TPA: response regulator [Blastocatellia bacterium]|nr:response regulator [Blastocatellia bacterium]
MQSSAKRILCADDDQHTNELLSFWLEKNGYEVKTVTTQTDALSLARRERFDLYLLDDLLPDGRGKDLVLMIRDFDPQTPIVFLSGNIDEANQQDILERGAQAFIPKPSNLTKVTELIEQLISKTP